MTRAQSILRFNRHRLSNSHPQLNVRVSHETDAALRKLANGLGVSMSAIVRAALDDYTTNPL